MAGLIDNLFGPLSIDYCIWFYFLSVLGYIWFFFYLISAVYMGIIKRKGGDYWPTVITVSLGYGIFYFQNRLLYTMCIGRMNR